MLSQSEDWQVWLSSPNKLQQVLIQAVVQPHVTQMRWLEHDCLSKSVDK